MFEEVQQIQLATKKGSCVAWCMASKQIRTEFCLELKRIFDDDNYVPGILRDLKVKYLSIYQATMGLDWRLQLAGCRQDQYQTLKF